MQAPSHTPHPAVRRGLRLSALLAAGFVAGGLAAAGAEQALAQDHTKVIRVSTVRQGEKVELMRVFFSDGARRPIDVRFVDRVFSDPSGLPVKLQGRYFMEVVFQGTGVGVRRFITRTLTPRRPLIRQIKLTSDYEGITKYAVGLTRRVQPRISTFGKVTTLRFRR